MKIERIHKRISECRYRTVSTIYIGKDAIRITGCNNPKVLDDPLWAGSPGCPFNGNCRENSCHYWREKIVCDPTKEPPCHLEPSPQLCGKCELLQEREKKVSKEKREQ